MTACLTSLALVGIIVIALSEEFLVSTEIIQFIPPPTATMRQRISRQSLSALRCGIPPSLTPMLP